MLAWIGAVGGFLTGLRFGFAIGGSDGDPGAGMANLVSGLGALAIIAILSVLGTAVGCYLALVFGHCDGAGVTTLMLAPAAYGAMGLGAAFNLPGHLSAMTIPIFARALFLLLFRRRR